MAGESLSRKKPATLSEVIDAFQEHLIAEQRAEATVSKYKRIIKEIVTLAASLERYRISEAIREAISATGSGVFFMPQSRVFRLFDSCCAA